MAYRHGPAIASSAPWRTSQLQPPFRRLTCGSGWTGHSLTFRGAVADSAPVRSAFASTQERVFRRLATWLLLAVGALALASPAFACALLTAPTKDCCPEGAPSPCKGEVPIGNASCCAVAPVSIQATACEAPRTTQVQPLDSNGADPLIIAAWIHSLDFHLASRSLPVDEWQSPARRDQLIYLQTRRLRL